MGNNNRKSFFSDHKSIGWIASLLIHLFIVSFILYFPHFVNIPKEAAYEGVLVSFGLPVETSDSESNPEETTIPKDEFTEMQKVEIEEEVEVENSLLEEESDVKVQERDEIKPSEKKPSIKSAPQEEVDELEKARDAFGKLFNKSANNSSSSERKGDPLGEPDASVLEGISKGRGRVGGGLDERGVLYEPEIVDSSQKSGKVVVRVCVDKGGKVLSAKFTQRGSTTTDSELVEIAESSARRYKFMPSEFEEQCGTISINFIVQ